MQNDKNYYFTSDFGICAALVSSGFSIVEVDRSDQRKLRFAFKYSLEVVEAVENYRRFELQVDARVYFEATKMIKSLIYDGNDA